MWIEEVEFDAGRIVLLHILFMLPSFRRLFAIDFASIVYDKKCENFQIEKP